MLTGSVALSLIQNTAILLSFSMLYDYIWAKEETTRQWYEKVLAGFVVGGIGLVLMFTPWTLFKGLIFDTRTILLAISGLFLGGIPTIIAIVITGVCRIIIGGDGVVMGLSVIISSGLIGILWGKFRPNWREGNCFLELLFLGILVHTVMLACTFLLPSEHLLKTLEVITFPIIFIYSPGTMLLGILMLKRSENWKNKKALRETQALYVSLVENMPAGVFRKNLEGRYDFVNSRFCALKGLKEEEIIGKNPMELSEYETTKEQSGLFKEIPRQRTLAFQGMENHKWIVKNKKSLELEESYLQSDGSMESFQVVKTPIFDIDGKVVGSQGMQFDITLQKRLQSDLLIAKEKAEESDRLKTAFLHNISHEIRTPMNAIVGFSNFLNDDNLSQEKRKNYVEVICQSSDQLLSIIDDIVRIATIEAGQENVNVSEFQLNVLCQLVYNQFLAKAEMSGIKLKVKTGMADGQDWVLFDQVKIQEVISNLLDNALKFTNKGQICLGYQIKEDKLEFFVEDTGIGIEEEYQEEIFRRFRQADSTLSRKFGGSGLGLSISKAYIALMGGRMWVKSQVGVGSIFYFTLPYKKSELSNKNESKASTEENSELIENNFTILVAEDEDLNFILLKEILAHLPVKVIRATNGAEAVDFVTGGNEVSLVLMDLKMPVMDGYEATKRINALYPELPIFALTAYSHDSDKERAHLCGCTDFISKPFRKVELIEKIKNCIS